MRFYFHLYNSGGWTYDREGQVFEGLPQARDAALKEARSLLASEIDSSELIDLTNFIAIDDEEGREVARVTFREAIKFVGE